MAIATLFEICDTHGQQQERTHQFFNYSEIFWTDFHDFQFHVHVSWI